MEIVTLVGAAIAGASAVGAPLTVFVKRVYETANALDKHTAEDSLRFEALGAQLVDLKNGQQNQTEKLDRLVERLL